MKEALNANTFFNTVAMVRGEVDSLILVVEGEDDYFVVKKHKSDDVYLMLSTGGRPALLEAAEQAERASLKGLKFLADGDFDWWLYPARIYPSNVVISNSHDLFMDLMTIGVEELEWAIETNFRRASRRLPTSVSPADLRMAALSLAAKISPVRVVNERKDMGLNLKDFPFGKFKTLDPTREEIAELVKSRSDTPLDAQQLAAEIAGETSLTDEEPARIVGDHDFFGSLSKVMHKYGAKGVGSDALCSSFISALNCRVIMRTSWFSSLTDWASSHGRLAFRCPCGT